MLAVSVALAGWSASPCAQAQLPPLVEISGQYLPTSTVPDAGGLRSQVSSYDAAVNVPIRLGERTFLVPGAQYHVDSVSYSHEPAGFTSVRALHSVSLPVLFAQQLSETWTLSFRAWPGLAGDREALDAGAFQVMATWAPSERVTGGAGVIATYGFGQLLPSLWLTGFVGHTLFRRYELKNTEGDAVPGGKVDLPNQLSVRAGLVFRIPMPGERG